MCERRDNSVGRVKDAHSPKITPDEKAVRAVIDDIRLHPEFTLSRRELIRYVLSELGKRSKEVQALLRLDELETLRTTLQKIANAEERAIVPLERTQREASDQLARTLDLTQLSSAKLLAAANEIQRRRSLRVHTLVGRRVGAGSLLGHC